MVKNHRDSLEVPLKRNIRWTLIIVILFFLGIFVDYMFLHLFFKEKMKERLFPHITPAGVREPNAPGTDAPKSGPSPTPESSPSAPSSTNPGPVEKFRVEVAKCFGAENPLTKATSSEGLVEELLTVNPPRASHMEVENTHIRLKDGSVRRMHLIPADGSDSNGSRELRFFSLDSEGLPVLISLPESARMNPTPEFLNSLKSEGTVFFHQLKENKLLSDGSHISLNTINDHIYEFQIFGKEKTFSCRELDCQCGS